MGVLYDYFIASDDVEAAGTLDLDGGPGQPMSLPPSLAQQLRDRGREARPFEDSARAQRRAVCTGIDPVVQGGTLEELLTGRPFEQIQQDPRWAVSVACTDDGGRMVLALTDGLIDGLAGASHEQLAAAAVPWSRTEEFWGAGDPDALVPLLDDLSSLARDARAQGRSVYCWVSV